MSRSRKPAKGPKQTPPVQATPETQVIRGGSRFSRERKRLAKIPPKSE